MPPNYGVGLHDEQSGTPIGSNSRQQCPENPITVPQPRCFRLLLQNRKLLSQREVLGGEFGSMTEQGPKEKDRRAK